MHNKYSVINIKDILKKGTEAEEKLIKQINDFSSKYKEDEEASDVERFLKNNAIEFTKKQQSVTYLVLSSEDASLLGYFAITIKPINIRDDSIDSNRMRSKIARVSELEDTKGIYTLSAYLIAQLGKNYANKKHKEFSGTELLNITLESIYDMQYRAGGMVVFLESEKKDELMNFYVNDNGFKKFDTKIGKENVELVQLLKIL